VNPMISRHPLRSTLTALLLAAAGGGCGTTGSTAAAAAPACDPASDRAAIRAMAGEYEVSFSFAESLALAAGYQLRDRYQTRGSELVLVVQDTPSQLSLQHLLVAGGTVIKHWRQDWTFQDPEVLEYRGQGAWEKRQLPPELIRCGWTQAVFEVNDAPRYEGWGRWQHVGGVSVWTSNETWRPLPRREYTKRDDYDVIVGVNRHVITPAGWAHEQDNSKVVLRGGFRPLVREHGVNTYDRARGRDFSAARAYWQRTGDFWREVRACWQHLIAQGPRLSLLASAASTHFQSLLALAEDPQLSRASDPTTLRQRIEGVIRRSWQPSSALHAASGR
jgi:hypothetical protein